MHHYFRLATLLTWIGIVICVIPSPLAAASNDLVFTASLDKTEYAPEEAVNATFILRNNGKKSVYVNKRFFVNSDTAPKNAREVSLAVTSSPGAGSASGGKLEFKFPGETGYPKSDYFELLEPGKEVKSEYPRNLRGNFEMNDPGVYTLTAVYQNVFGRELGLDVFQGKLTAESVKFTIKKQGQ
ncbi:MAG: hypothetical protein HZA28_01060 [Candidatus Omnitrophica bacterium]|nr:hypothetical protein [Candidatus Omnitrophota bacterium]